MTSPASKPRLPVTQVDAQREVQKPPKLPPRKPQLASMKRLEALLASESSIETNAPSKDFLKKEKKIFAVYSSTDSATSSDSSGSVDSQEKRGSASKSGEKSPLSITQLFEDLRLEARPVTVKVIKKEEDAGPHSPLAFLEDLGKTMHKSRGQGRVAGFNLDF